MVADGHFDLPATGISKDDLPGEFGGEGRFGGEEIPGGLVFASGDDQPERLEVSGIEDREGNDPGLAFALVTGIPQVAVVPGAFALGDFTRFVQLFLLIEQVVVFGPAQDKASPPQKGLCQPGIACKAAIPDMHDVLAPQLVDIVEDLGFFAACLAASPRVVHHRRCASVGGPLCPRTSTCSQ